jgi:hypothetical protein
MKLTDLRPGDTIDRTIEGAGPLLYERRVASTGPDQFGDYLVTYYSYVFRDLETWREFTVYERLRTDKERSERWSLLERSHLPASSGNVTSDGGKEAADGEEAMNQNLTSQDPAETTAEVPSADGIKTSTKKTRTVDYTRTDKRPHSFRYKRHSTFVARSGAVTLSKDADGAFVIGPAPEGSTAEAGQLTAGQLELVSVKKRPNGKTAIAFKHAELGEVVAYDARAARAALRVG